MNIFLLTAFLSFFLSTQANDCFQTAPLTVSDPEILTLLTEKLARKEAFQTSCLELLIKRGFYKAAGHLYENYFLVNGITVKTEVAGILASNKRDLDLLYHSIMSSDTRTQIIEPVFQWAQSYKYVYIQVKFAHRLDSPGCLSVKNEVVNLTKNTLFLSAFGIQTHQPITFTLNMTLFGEIVPENSTWNLEAVGTMFFNLTKTNGTLLWRRLIESKNKKIPVWWHMNSEQSVEMREFARILDDEDEEREKDEDNKRKSKRNKKQEKKTEKVEEANSKQEDQEDPEAEEFKLDL